MRERVTLPDQEVARKQELWGEFSSIIRRATGDTTRFAQNLTYSTEIDRYKLFFAQNRNNQIPRGDFLQISTPDAFATFILTEDGIQRGLVPNAGGQFNYGGHFPRIKRFLELAEMENLIKTMRSPHLSLDLLEDLVTPTEEEKTAFDAHREELQKKQRDLWKTLEESARVRRSVSPRDFRTRY